MTQSSPLVAIVVGVGLAVLTSRDITRARRDDGQAQGFTPLFVLAVQLIGLAIVGAALYIAAYSFESGRKLGPHDLKAENLLIATLVVLIVLMGIRNTWNSLADTPATAPWERGLTDRMHPLPGFMIAILIVALLGLAIDETLIALSVHASGATRLPTPALHSQAVTVWAGLVLRSRRGLRRTPITTRWWWADAWRSHRDQPAPPRTDLAPSMRPASCSSPTANSKPPA